TAGVGSTSTTCRRGHRAQRQTFPSFSFSTAAMEPPTPYDSLWDTDRASGIASSMSSRKALGGREEESGAPEIVWVYRRVRDIRDRPRCRAAVTGSIRPG